MKSRFFETFFGFVIIVMSMLFCMRIYRLSSRDSVSKPYTFVKARFSNIEGVSVGGAVKIGGVKVGKVSDISLDEDLNVIVTLFIGNGISISSDSSISIISSGLLGAKYIEITPGFDDDKLNNGDFFRSTKSVLNIENLIGNFAFNKKK